MESAATLTKPDKTPLNPQKRPGRTKVYEPPQNPEKPKFGPFSSVSILRRGLPATVAVMGDCRHASLGPVRVMDMLGERPQRQVRPAVIDVSWGVTSPVDSKTPSSGVAVERQL